MYKKLLLSAAAAVGLKSGMAANARFAFGKTFGERPTKRKPERRVAAPIASTKRARRRAEAQSRFDRQIEKERAIGVDPIFLHGSSLRKDALRPGWLKKSAEWDRAHG
jgi:hypothetical protein